MNEGQFVFEFGGAGNNEKIHTALYKAFANHNRDYHVPFYFPTIGEYAPLLKTAGFKVIYAVLFDRFTALKGDNGLYDWIQMFVKAPFQQMCKEEKESILPETVADLKENLFYEGIWYADYVRTGAKRSRENRFPTLLRLIKVIYKMANKNKQKRRQHFLFKNMLPPLLLVYERRG